MSADICKTRSSCPEKFEIKRDVLEPWPPEHCGEVEEGTIARWGSYMIVTSIMTWLHKLSQFNNSIQPCTSNVLSSSKLHCPPPVKKFSGRATNRIEKQEITDFGNDPRKTSWSVDLKTSGLNNQGHRYTVRSPSICKTDVTSTNINLKKIKYQSDINEFLPPDVASQLTILIQSVCIKEFIKYKVKETVQSDCNGAYSNNNSVLESGINNLSARSVSSGEGVRFPEQNSEIEEIMDEEMRDLMEGGGHVPDSNDDIPRVPDFSAELSMDCEEYVGMYDDDYHQFGDQDEEDPQQSGIQAAEYPENQLLDDWRVGFPFDEEIPEIIGIPLAHAVNPGIQELMFAEEIFIPELLQENRIDAADAA